MMEIIGWLAACMVFGVYAMLGLAAWSEWRRKQGHDLD
jgi:hypothetical protein